MTNKKHGLMFGIAVLFIAAIFAISFAGCKDSSDDSGGGGVQLPANLKNTKWVMGSTNRLEFKETTVIIVSSMTEEEWTVTKAAEGGEIAIKRNIGSGVGSQTLCASYTITATTLTLSGGNYNGFTYTKQQ